MNMYKWKGGIILFLFLSAIGFLLIDPLHAGDMLGELFSIFFSSFFLTIIFLVAIKSVETKILDNSFSFKWFIKFNLIFSVIVYAFLLVTSIILTYFTIKSGRGGDMAGLIPILVALHGLWVAPALVLVFSVITQLFFYKFRLNRKILFSVVILFSLLLVSAALYYSLNLSFCSFNSDIECLASKALVSKDLTICERIKTDYRPQDYKRDICYRFISNQWEDVRLCDKIKDERNKYECTVNIAININDQNICDRLKSVGTEYTKEKCFSDFQNGDKFWAVIDLLIKEKLEIISTLKGNTRCCLLGW